MELRVPTTQEASPIGAQIPATVSGAPYETLSMRSPKKTQDVTLCFTAGRPEAGPDYPNPTLVLPLYPTGRTVRCAPSR